MGMVPGAAEGIEQRGSLVPAGSHQQGGGQGLAQGSLGDRLAVAALVQQRPGRIHADRAFIVQQADDDQLGRLVAVFVGFQDGGRLSQALFQRGGDGAGDGIRMVEFRFVAGDAQGNRLTGSEEAFPGQAGRGAVWSSGKVVA